MTVVVTNTVSTCVTPTPRAWAVATIDRMIAANARYGTLSVTEIECLLKRKSTCILGQKLDAVIVVVIEYRI